MAAYLGPEETRKDYLQAQDAQIDYSKRSSLDL